MPTADQALASELHGTALLLAQDERFQPVLDRLAEIAGGRDDLRTHGRIYYVDVRLFSAFAYDGLGDPT